jgi:predicted DNA-binding WGR domain protein
MSAIVLHRIEPEKNMARFYRLDVQPDLFGWWSFIREWGHIGRPGQVRAISYPSTAEAFAALQRQQQAKQRRGYQ